MVVSWWRSNTKEVKNWAQCGTYFNANICMISFSKEKISRPLCQIANQRSWPTIYASLYHHSYSTMLKNCKNNSFLHQKLHKGWFAGFFHLRIKICRLTFESMWNVISFARKNLYKQQEILFNVFVYCLEKNTICSRRYADCLYIILKLPICFQDSGWNFFRSGGVFYLCFRHRYLMSRNSVLSGSNSARK